MAKSDDELLVEAGLLQLPKDKEVCPSCGEFVDELSDATGWCNKCSGCEKCNNPTDVSHKRCRACRHEDYLERHADDIDRCLGNGMSLRQALILLRRVNNETLECLSCGDKMKKSNRGQRLFCAKEKCRTAQNKLKWLQYHKKIPREEALKLVLEGL